MSFPAPLRLRGFSLRVTKRSALAALALNRKTIASQLLAVSLVYALSLQLLPPVAIARPSPIVKMIASEKPSAENVAINAATNPARDGVFVNAFNEVPAGGNTPATVTDAVVSKHKPTLNSGRIEGSLRVLLAESFTISGNTQITSDLYVPGTPAIQLSGAARYAGTVSDGGVAGPSNYTVSLSGDVDLPGKIHTQVDPVTLPEDFPASIPAAGGTRTISINSQSDIAAIGSWRTVRDLSVSRSGLTVNVPPGNYGTFTVNGNSRLNFTAGTYNFANTFNLDGSASIQATGLVIINIAKSLTVTSGALVAGTYTSPGDVHLNVLGPTVNVNGSSQICGLLRADNAAVSISGIAQIRGQVIADSFTLNGGKVIGAVWPAHSGGSITTFGPRRFDRTTGPPNQYLEQFSLPANATSPYTLHIQNGAPDGANRVSSATVKLNGVVILSPNDLNQTVAGMDRTVTLVPANTLEVILASVPGSYLIVDIGGIFPPGDTTPPTIAISSPLNNSTTTDSQIAVSVTASDPGPGPSGVAQVYVNDQEATYYPGDNTWAAAGVALSIGANSIIAKAVDQSGNQATASITVTRENPNQPPVVNAGADQNLALPQTASLHGSASDDGLPQGSTLVSSWSMIAGPGTVSFDDATNLNAIATFSLAGTYVLRLSADDGLLSSSDDVTVTVQPENQPPTVTAGADQTIALPHTATLNGSATDDQLPQDSNLTVAWTQVSGPGTTTFAEAYLSNTTATFSEPGSYVLRLAASDSELTSASELTITVQPENLAPTVNAGPDQFVALPAQAVLNGSVADDGWPAGSSLTETWTVVSGPAAAGIGNPNTTLTVATFSVAGTYVLRLTASDGELSDSDELVITVDPQNQAPLVGAGPDQTVTLSGQLSLDAVITDDGWPRNGRLTVNWSQVSGPGTATIAHPDTVATSVSFSAAGVYVLRLTASDSQLSTSDELSVTVIDPRAPPVADFVVPESSGTAGSFVIASSGPASGSFSVDKILDSNISTVWATPGVNNQFAKLQFFDQESVFIDRVRLQPASGAAATTCVRDFDVQVSATDSNDASFVNVLSATLLNNGQLQEFVLPGGLARARYLKFVPKNNYGSASSIQLGTFTAVAVGSADSIISLPGQTNAALTQSPGLIANGATIYSSSDPFGSLPPNGLLGYRNGGWSPSVNTHPFAIIQLAGSGLYSLSGIKLATGWNFGFAQATAVRNFEVWVSATTPDDASFTRVLAATAIPSGQLYTFIFPGGKVAARYVKYVPLTNSGGSTIDTQTFDVIAEGSAQLVSASSQNQDSLNPAEAAFDSDVNSIWFSQNNAVTNVWAKTSLADGLAQKLYGVRINPVNDSSNGQHAPRDFEIRVSTTTADEGAFTTVYSGTLANVLNGGPQEFLFSNFVEAKYVQFFWKNGYSIGNIGVRTLEVLAVPNRGSALVAFSTQEDPAGNALDLDPGNQWVTAFNNPTNQWLKLLLPRAELQIIRHIALRPAIAATHSAPKDFEFQVSTNDAADTSFTTVVAGTLANSTQLQDFYFPPAPARYVRLLLKNNYGGSRFGLASFYVYAADQIGTRTRFIDRSTDADDQIVSWVWNFGDGATSTERNPLHTYAASGDYTVSLTATDSSGLANTHQVLYHVLDSLRVDFSASPQIAHEGGDQVRFTDITRLLGQPTALRQYDFGDGVTLSQALNTSLHQFAENGTYHVTLNIGDPLGVSYTATKDIVVLNVAPAVDILNGKTVVWGEAWTSVPTITDQSVLDRLTLQGQWNFGDGQITQCVNCTAANATTTHAYSNPGTYTVTFAVTDRDGGVGSDSATYVVNKRATSITFLTNSLQGSGQTFLSRVKLTDSFDNSRIPNRAIQFNLNGTTGSATTDAGGMAEITLPVSANANVALLSATWAGDGLYLASNNNASTTLNFAPTVNAGVDQAITLPCGVSLSGSVNDDGVPSGIPLGILWAKISGPGNVAFADAGAAQTTATFSAAGKYVLRLTANDTRLQSSDDITVTVNVVEVGTSQYFAPVPYLSFADSPLSGRSPSYFYLETFEDHLLNTPGVAASAGGVTSVVFGSNLHDSIDADDGVLDGSGLNGDSYINGNGAAGIRFSFNATVLGSLPTHAGLVWTDGGGQVYFEAFDRNGFSMGLQGPFNFPDAVNNGTTAEDRFLGAYNKDGISAIRVLNTVGGLEIDHLQYGFSVGNSPPIVNAGNDQNIALPTTAFTLNGVVTDDGLPACNTPVMSWSFVSGPGAVSFANAQSVQTTVTLTTIGQYVLRLTAGDSQYIASDDVVINLLPPNHAPVVSAGDDQAITLPANTVSLHGTATDDGQPAGSTLAVSWNVLSAPAAVTFASANALNTTASFSEPGTYVLRFTAGDSQLIATDDLVVVVNASLTPNQPPGAAAGSDQTITLHSNLVLNPSAEQPLVSNELPGWSEVQGSNWTQATINSGDNFPEAQRGNSYFFANEAPQAELRQDVDVSAFSKTIDDGTQQFELKVYLRSAPEAVPDVARVIFEYRNATNSAVIAQLDSGPVSSTVSWHLTEDIRSAPPGTGWVRVRLIATRNSGATNDAFFDSISLRPLSNVAIQLAGVVSDDGLPLGSSILASWTKLSGPGNVDFSDPNAATTSASFNTAGNYVLRLHASDGSLGTDDDVNVTVNPPNQAPAVNAGSNQTITLPATASLDGSAIDDGFPIGSSVSVAWSRSSGPGQVTFANANSLTTAANFSAAGVYVLRLTADDGEETASSELTISVTSQPVNQPPAVNAGPDQTISLPTDTVTLHGTAADDGLPAGSLNVAWSTVTGPATAVFGNAGSAETTVQFNATGTYVLRLTAGDGELSRDDDVVVTVMPAPAENQPPTANAGTDQTVLLSTGAQLNGSAGDDGLPAGNLTTNWTEISGPGAVTLLNPNVTITGALFSVTGTYVLRLTAGDGALTASDEITVTVIDNVAPPTVAITTPSDGSSITEPSSITGSVSNGAWVLEYSLDNDDNANNRVWTTFAHGNTPVFNAELGTLDPTMMLNGLFDIRLSATDSYGQISRVSIAVIVERNFKVGNFTVSFSDLNLPVAGVPMEVTRTYDSRDKRVGDFGFGWTLGLHNIRLEKSGGLGFKWYETVSQELIPNYCLEATGSHLVAVTFPGGKVFKFQAAVTPHCQRFTAVTSGTLTFIPLAGTHGTLEIVGAADFQVDGSVPGPVNLIGFGGGVDIFNSSLFKFTADDGTAFVIDQRAGLQSISDTNNNTVTVSAGGIIHSNGKSITFNRDALGRITGVVDPAGNTQSYTYDSSGDLVSYTDNESNTSLYTYDANHRLLTIHDPRGVQPVRNDYDAEGRLISHTDGFGKIISYLHDIPGRVETMTDRLGQPTRFEYDQHGNVLSKTDARAGVTSFTYDSNDNLLTETNALGKTTTNTYDPSDRRTSITDPLGNVTRFTYNALGKVLAPTDPRGHVTTNTYNAAGNLLTTRDALNNTTSFGYSVFDGQRTSMTDALGNLTSYTYTGGYLTKETDALGHDTTFTYDANGNRAGQTVKRTNVSGQLEAITTSYEYDHLNRLRKTTFADGTFTQVEYNSIGQQRATIDQLGRRTEFTYDDMGRLTGTGYPDGTEDETTYDAEGRRLTSKDRAGHVTSYTYDELGRLIKTTYADGTFAQTSDDPLGQALTTTDARGNVTRYFYDDAGRRTKVKNALNQETTFTYDANSNQLSITDALGHTTSYEYDLDNRRTKTTYADSTFASVGYDALGRTVSRIDQAGKTTQFIYDAAGRLTKVKDSLNQETTYAYDDLGRQISQTDANNHTTRFEYDQLGRRVKRILPVGQFETYSYQSDGNLQSRTDFNGKTTTFIYDLMRRLLTRVPDSSLHQPTVSFTYDSAGQRSTMNDASGVTTYSYDIRNRLTSKQTPFGTLSYTYNEAGNLATTGSSNPNGVSLDYSYDALNRLETVKDNNLLALNGGITNYTYDSVGNLQGYSYPNGVTSSYSYNSLNRLTTITVGTTGPSFASYSYTLGPTGNRTAVTELSGRTVNYSYDDLYRLTGETIANDPHGINGGASYNYDPVGNRLDRSSSIAQVPSQSSTYDANDRLTSDSYDNNGNTTSSSGNGYTYDFENHLTSLNGGSVRYVYDGDGNRVTKTVGGVSSNYLIDSNNPTSYAQVVEELQSGAVVKSFTYGHDLISQRAIGGGLSFYGYDGHGSVRLLTDATAAVTDTYDYDAFGNLISRTGTTANDYLYSGEQFDANLGFYYLRARYMNPSNGRFFTMDPVEGATVDPLSLHKYALCSNNATNCTDPSGNIGIADSIGEINALTWRATLFVGQYQRVITAGSLLLKTLDIALTFGDTEYRDLSFTLGHNPFESVASLAADAMLAFRYSRVGAEAPYIAERAASAISDLTIVNAGSTLPERELINFTRWSASPTVVEETEVLYRVHTPGRATGSWWTRIKPQSEIQFRIDSALRPEWNDATELSTMVVPKGYGLQAWEGAASYQGGFYVGGGNQLFIPNAPAEWITTVPFP